MLSGLAALGFILASFLMINRDLTRADDDRLKKEGKELLGQLKEKKVGLYALKKVGSKKQKDGEAAEKGDKSSE